MRRSYGRYLVGLLATVAAIAGAVLTVNLLVDPLWYLHGNVISGMNYQYNERHSKAFRFMKDPDQYDCIILGSSTGSLLNENKIAGYNCFNFSFSHGNISEYVSYAKFARRFTRNIRLVIVSVDAYNLLNAELDDWSPLFVRDSDVSPPSVLASYLDRDTFYYSLRALTKGRDQGIYYRSDFTAAIHPGSPTYEPQGRLTSDFQRRFGHKATDPFSERNIALFRELGEVFPDAEYVGVAPPIAAHYVAFLRLANTLNGLLEAKHALTAVFDRFYDFSLPSAVTKDPTNTYDGEHFDLSWNDRVVAILNAEKYGDARGGEVDFGVRVHELSLRHYRALFLALTDDFIAETRLTLR